LFVHVEFFRLIAKHEGGAIARDLVQKLRHASAVTPFSRTLVLASELAEPVLAGVATWEEAQEHVERLAWAQNSS
jgi:hypothetical protein